MCVIDWTATGTWALVLVGAVAAYFAYQAARSALEALRLESEPVISVSVAVDDPPKGDHDVIVNDMLELIPQEPGTLPHERTRFIIVENVGRAPALDIQLFIETEFVEGGLGRMILYIQGLAPQGKWALGVHVPVDIPAVRIDIVGGQRISFSRKGGTEPLRLFRSTAFPLSI